jgi:G3E family GTPase
MLRMKGIVNVAGEDTPIAVHGVQHLFHPPARIPRWPDEDRRSKFVFIVREIPRKEIEDSLARFQDEAEKRAVLAART